MHTVGYDGSQSGVRVFVAVASGPTVKVLGVSCSSNSCVAAGSGSADEHAAANSTMTDAKTDIGNIFAPHTTIRAGMGEGVYMRW